MKAILFAEWLMENNYILDNLGIKLWRNGKYQKTTKQLYKEFEKQLNK